MKKLLVLLLAAVLLGGCVSSEITYEKADKYDVPIERLFIVEVFPEDKENFTEAFESKFIGYLDKAGIETGTFHYIAHKDNLSLEEEDTQEKELKKSIDEFAPFHLMSIAFRLINKVGGDETMKFEIIIRDMVTEKKVWVANVETESGTYSTNTAAAKEMAEELIKSMVESKLFNRQIPLF